MSMAPDAGYEAEFNLVGGLLVDPGLFDEVAAVVQPADFAEGRNRVLFEAMIDVRAAGPLNVVALFDALTARGLLAEAGGVAYLDDLGDRAVGIWATTLCAAGIVKRKARLRSLRRECARAVEEMDAGAGADDEHGYVASVEDRIANLAGGATTTTADRDAGRLRAVLGATLNEIGKAMGEREDPGIPTGYPGLDDLLLGGGLLPGHVVVVGSRTNMGKTAFALSLASNLARADCPVLFLTNEQPVTEVGHRVLASEAHVPLSRLGRPRQLLQAETDRLVETTDRIAGWPLWLVDASGWTVTQIRGAVAAHREHHAVRVVCVDYVQLVRATTPDRNSREREVAEVSRGIKRLAIEYGVAVVAMAQLNRETEKRKDSRPTLVDLRESGALEQDADVVLLIHRASRESKDAELIIAKNRHGPPGTVGLIFRPDVVRFETRIPGHWYG